MQKILSVIRTLLILLFIFNALTSESQSRFEGFQPGSTSETVTDVFKDSQGMIWVGTTMGLYMYDGNEFTAFYTKLQDKYSISDNNILCINEDKQGYLWIGTMDGLNRFDRKSNTFERFYASKSDFNSLLSNNIRCMYIDENDNLWIGNYGGVVCLNAERTTFRRYLTDVKVNNKPELLQPSAIIAKDKNTLWIGSWSHGLIELNLSSGNFKMMLHDPQNPNSLAYDNILSFYYEKSTKTLWIGHYNNFLSAYDVSKGNFISFKPPFYKSDFSVKSIIRNTDGNLWLGTTAGLIIYDKDSRKFNLNQIEINNFLPDNPAVNKLMPDVNGLIWLASNKLFLYNPLNNRFGDYKITLPRENAQIKQNYLKAFYKDQYQQIWMGTFSDGIIIKDKGGKTKRFYLDGTDNNIQHIIPLNVGILAVSTAKGLYFLDIATKKVLKKYVNNPLNSNSIFHNNILMTYPDRKGYLWIVTQESIDRLNLRTDEFTHYTKNNPNGISFYKGTSIALDRTGNVWIGTFMGLNRFNQNTGKFTQYLNNPNDNYSISKSFINSILCTKDGEIWITTTKGLNKYNAEKDEFTHYFESDGFASDQMGDLVEDEDKNLWITTNLGISRFTPSTGKVVNFDNKDGIDPNVESIYIDASNNIYVGGRHYDYYSFNPNKITDNKLIPPIVITDFKIYNQSIKNSIDKESVKILSDLYNKNKITLSYNQTVFSFVFSALNYVNSEKNQYKYKLEGFDKDWILTDSKNHQASYTNINPGTYTFRVIASNNDGHWNEEGLTIIVKIEPPFWLSWYAYLLYILFVAAILLFLRNRLIAREKERHRIASEKMEAERTHELDQLKLQFFSNISHELRTPLTLILGPVKHLTKQLTGIQNSEQLFEQLQLIQRNTLRMEHLISEIMDTFKADAGSMKLKVGKFDLTDFIRNIAILFNPIAEDKNIAFNIIAPETKSEIWFDAEKFEKVIYNLLSNAFKFTDSGNVDVLISYEPVETADFPYGFARITVKDTGCGIAPDEVKNVFMRFFQARNQSKANSAGTGLGMALSKELIDLHKGKISVNSTLNKGTQYDIQLHLGDYLLSYSDVSEQADVHTLHRSNIEMLIKSEFENQEMLETTSEKQKLPHLLIVEDNRDLRIYLKNLLKDKYKVEMAADGEAGLKKAIELMPDMILSDVMMPVMDGFEMAKQLRNNPQICHIPIILLTARDSDEYKIEGLETGAFDYITKPFNEEVLLLKLSNILANKVALSKFLVESFVNDTLDREKFVVSDVHIPSSDKTFIEKLKRIMEENISNSDFSIELLASTMNMSLRNMNRKINSLLNCSALELLIDLRLNKAKVLVEESDLNVSDIAFECGFYDANYFGKCFKKRFGQSPKDYRKTIK